MNRNQRKNKHFTWKKYHKWFGLVLSVFMLIFCISGIILNHRQLFANCEVSRSLMPSDYHIKNYNNGIIKGTQKIGKDSILAYGYGGVWLTDTEMKHWQEFNQGLPECVDGRNIRNMVLDKNGKIWCAAMYDVYLYDGKKWTKFDLPGNHERITDIALAKDSTKLVALSRSAVFTIAGNHITHKVISCPADFIPETTLFKTVWTLHSGEFFGLAGRLVVDVIAVVLIILSITGIILFILPYGIRHQKRLMTIEEKRTSAKEKMIALGKRMVWNAKWHNKIGYATIILTLWISITGMCLRPPLMIPLALNKIEQKVEDGNVWKDKLRAIRWDAASQRWLISTSEGFMWVNEDFSKKPILLDKNQTPKVSPMGVTVFENDGNGGWLIGSFSGMFRWYPTKNLLLDYFTGKPQVEKSMIPISSSLVSGYSQDFFGGKELVFDYAKGASFVNNEKNKEQAESHISMPKLLSDTPMSLWNVALELHVGRCYSPFLGPISNLFVFLSGLLISLVLLSGYIILHRRGKKKSKRATNENK